jgi:hypothetical protein
VFASREVRVLDSENGSFKKPRSQMSLNNVQMGGFQMSQSCQDLKFREEFALR